MSEPRLTRAQLEAWSTFGREWGPFKEAWMGRGFLLPPTGNAADDDELPSQRSMLWKIANERPNDLGRWVREAPGRSTREVIDHVLRQWQKLRADFDEPDDYDDRKRAARLADDTPSMRDILGRVL